MLYSLNKNNELLCNNESIFHISQPYIQHATIEEREDEDDDSDHVDKNGSNNEEEDED